MRALLKILPFHLLIKCIIFSTYFSEIFAEEYLSLSDGVVLAKTEFETFSASVCPCKERCLKEEKCQGVTITKDGPADTIFRCSFATEQNEVENASNSKIWTFLKESPATTTTSEPTTTTTSEPTTTTTSEPTTTTTKPPKKTTTTSEKTTTPETPTTTTSSKTTTEGTTEEDTTEQNKTTTEKQATTTTTTEPSTSSSTTTVETTTTTTTPTTTTVRYVLFYHSRGSTAAGDLETLKGVCEPSKGVPAILTNYKNDYEVMKSQKQFGSPDKVWLSLRRTTDGKLEWYDGTKFTFDDSQITGDFECYLTTYDGVISDVDCSQKLAYLVFCQARTS